MMNSKERSFRARRSLAKPKLAQAWNSYKEYVFLVFLAVLCTLVAVFQFEWIGRLADAEKKTVLENRKMAAVAFCTAFDHELSIGCKEVLSALEELGNGGGQPQSWNLPEIEHRNMFKRVALLGVSQADIKMIDLETGRVEPSVWPEEWRPLKDHLSSMFSPSNGPPGPFGWEGDGLLILFPFWTEHGEARVGSGPGIFPRSPPQLLILELDREDLQDTWLPSLVERFLDPGAQGESEVLVLNKAGQNIFARYLEGPVGDEVVVDFNRRGRSTEIWKGPQSEGAWRLEVRKRSGDLEALVAASRKRNLIAAGAVNCLIFLSGAALARQSRKARIFAEAQMDFVASVSHEFRTPVTVILGAAHNLERGIATTAQDVVDYGGMIRRQANQLSKMVREVLEFSSIKKGTKFYSDLPLDVGDVLLGALRDSESETVGMKLEVAIQPMLPQIRGDAEALQRAFGNLIRNAAKHAASGGWIGIQVENHGDRIIIELADHGPGIPRSEQAQVFNAFFRGALARENQVRGSGIGLGLVKEIIEAHHGQVTLRSDPGNGATFFVILPAA